MLYDTLIDIGHTILKNGFTLSSLGAILFLLLKNRRLKRYINAHLPKMLRDQEDERTKRIERKVDALLAHEGIEVICGNIGTSSNTEVRSLKKSFSLLHKAIGRKGKMNMQKFKSRKFWMAVISGVLVILNDGMDLGIDNQTVMAFAGIVMSFIFGEAYVDSKRTGGQANAQHIDSSEFEG